jgi:Reverse transcriptase (RNA-dependent DNA polymerase)
MSEAKPYCISKWEVWEAYKKVKANQGAAGVDAQTIADFEKREKDNLYKIWNRMSSGSYFPPPVRTVKIPKANGGERTLGIPTVSDRIAQMVVKTRLEPAVDPLFHPDSYGYRPGKSALEAVGQARQRCWAFDWVVDLDIKGFFDYASCCLLREPGVHDGVYERPYCIPPCHSPAASHVRSARMCCESHLFHYAILDIIAYFSKHCTIYFLLLTFFYIFLLFIINDNFLYFINF